MKNIRVGDTVYHLYHMSNKGVVQEIYTVPTRFGNASGPFSRVVRIKFLSELDGKVYDMKLSDVVKDN